MVLTKGFALKQDVVSGCDGINAALRPILVSAPSSTCDMRYVCITVFTSRCRQVQQRNPQQSDICIKNRRKKGTVVLRERRA